MAGLLESRIKNIKDDIKKKKNSAQFGWVILIISAFTGIYVTFTIFKNIVYGVKIDKDSLNFLFAAYAILFSICTAGYTDLGNV